MRRSTQDDELAGAQVTLLPLRAADAGELAGLLDDAYVRDALGVDDVEGLRQRFARWESRRSPDGGERWLNWVVRQQADGRAVGWAQATVRRGGASVAYALLTAERGQGAASDAVRAMTAWLRTELDVDEVTASIAPHNVASAHVARAAVFTPTDRRHDGEVIWVADGGGWKPNPETGRR